MRLLTMAGILMLGLGAFALPRGASFTFRSDLFKVGDAQIRPQEQESAPPWVGGAALVVGVALVVAAARKRT